jgi:hypothetical protein
VGNCGGVRLGNNGGVDTCAPLEECEALRAVTVNPDGDWSIENYASRLEDEGTHRNPRSPELVAKFKFGISNIGFRSKTVQADEAGLLFKSKVQVLRYVALHDQPFNGKMPA